MVIVSIPYCIDPVIGCWTGQGSKYQEGQIRRVKHILEFFQITCIWKLNSSLFSTFCILFLLHTSMTFKAGADFKPLLPGSFSPGRIKVGRLTLEMDQTEPLRSFLLFVLPLPWSFLLVLQIFLAWNTYVKRRPQIRKG